MSRTLVHETQEGLLPVEMGKHLYLHTPDGENFVTEDENQRLVSTEGLRRLGPAVSSLLRQKGWTIKQACKITKLSPETLIKLKSGDPTLRLGTIKRFATAVGESPELWLDLVERVDAMPMSNTVMQGLLDLRSLDPQTRALMRMLVDQLVRPLETENHSFRDVVRQPFRGGEGLLDDEKVVAVSICGPTYAGLMGEVITQVAALGANIINTSARDSANVSAIFLRVVVDVNVPHEDIQQNLADLLNEFARPVGSVDKSMPFVVVASDESHMERGPLVGLELSLLDEPGALKAALGVVYRCGWVPVGIEYSLPEHQTEQVKCLMAVEPCLAILNKFKPVEVATLLFDLKSHDLILDAVTSFESAL